MPKKKKSCISDKLRGDADVAGPGPEVFRSSDLSDCFKF